MKGRINFFNGDKTAEFEFEIPENVTPDWLEELLQKAENFLSRAYFHGQSDRLFGCAGKLICI